MRAFSLPVPPSANRYWRHADGRTYVSEEALTYRELVAWHCAALKVTPLDGKVTLGVVYYPKAPKDAASRAKKDPANWDMSVRALDLGNIEKVLSDALNGIAWHDDKQVFAIALRRGQPVAESRIDVIITQL